MKIEVKKNILATNAGLAAENRERLERHGVFMLNIMASPGAGKTSVITKAIEETRDRLNIGVIEGDIASEIDSLAIEAMEIPSIQINTGGSCHLTANMVASALDNLDLNGLDLIIIENVGNLVCPAEFDLGESARLLIASVAEGDDKPYKYPMVFREANVILVNKTDLLTHCDFNLMRFHEAVRGLNPAAAIIELSCREGDGVDEWSRWLLAAVSGGRADLPS